MKYLFAGAAASLLIAGAALAQPAASVGGAVGSTLGQAGATATGTANTAANTPLAPAAPVDQSADHANHTAGGATVNAEKSRDKKPNASLGGAASTSTDTTTAQGSATTNTGG